MVDVFTFQQFELWFAVTFKYLMALKEGCTQSGSDLNTAIQQEVMSDEVKHDEMVWVWMEWFGTEWSAW